MVYPTSQADCFPQWNKNTFYQQCETLSEAPSYIAVTEKGFIKISLIEKIIYFVKGLLGGQDKTEASLLQSNVLKLLYFGEAHDLITISPLRLIKKRFTYPFLATVHPTVEDFFKKIQLYHQRKPNQASKAEYLSTLRELMLSYHHDQALNLKPGYWSRLLNPPTLNSKELLHFGDTPLQLAEQALNEKNVPQCEAFSYLKKAFELHNDAADFQVKLAEKLAKIQHSSLFELPAKKREFQDLWLQLARTAFINHQCELAHSYLGRALEIDNSNQQVRLEIGKLYLRNQDYERVEPFLNELKNSFSSDPKISMEIGHVYWEKKKYGEALVSYKKALKEYEKKSSSSSQITLLNERIGIIYLQKLPTDPSTLVDAIHFFYTSCQHDSTVHAFQANLCEALIQQWSSHRELFLASHPEHLFFLFNCIDVKNLKKFGATLIPMGFACSEYYFKSQEPTQAHLHLSQLLNLFKSDVNIKIQALDLALQFHEWDPLKPFFEEWKNSYRDHPLLLKKIADVLWECQETLALPLYQEALTLFEDKLSTCHDQDVEKMYRLHILNLSSKIGSFQLKHQLQAKTTFFKKTSFEKALALLEKAYQLDPKSHGIAFSEACLAAAKAEEQLSWPKRDEKQLIIYYQKAFESGLRNGPYLVRLMELYFAKSRYDEAIQLYHDIQKQPWAETLTLPAKLFQDLAHQLSARQDFTSAVKIYESLYKTDPKNKKNKELYFHTSLTVARNLLAKFEAAQMKGKAEIESLLQGVTFLEKCWNEGFENTSKALLKRFQTDLGELYKTLAEECVDHFLLSKPKKEMDSKEIKLHQTKYKHKILEAIKYYNLALKYDPKNASLHFEKGVILEWWVGAYEKALAEYALAIQYQPRNPFYHKLAASLSSVLNHAEQAEEHERLALSYMASESEFYRYLNIWKEQQMCKQQVVEINPHDFTQKSSSWL